MNDLRRAAEAAKSLHKQFKALLEVGQALDEIADLEQRFKEAATTHEAAKQASEQAQAELEALQRKTQEAAERLTKAQADADRAAAAAERTRADGERTARKMIDEAQERVAKMIEDADIEIAAKRAAACSGLEALEGEIAALEGSRDTLRNEIAALRKRLEGV